MTTKFYVLNYDFNSNKVYKYDVIPYLLSKLGTNKEYTREEIKEIVEKESMYQWWSRCEYEIIISDWPNKSHEEKWDIHGQVMMNIDIIVDILENIRNKKTLNYDGFENK